MRAGRESDADDVMGGGAGDDVINGGPTALAIPSDRARGVSRLPLSPLAFPYIGRS